MGTRGPWASAPRLTSGGLSPQYVPQAEASVLQQQQYYQWYQQYSYAYPYSYYYPVVSAQLRGAGGLSGAQPGWLMD